MKRLFVHGLALVLCLPAVGADAPVTLPDLIARTIARDDATQAALHRVQYHQTLTIERLGENGQISKKQVTQMLIRPDGTPEVQVLSAQGDDLPSDPDQAAAQAKGQEEQRKKTHLSLRELSSRFNLTLLGRTTLDGVPAFLLGFEPKPNQPYKNQTERFVNNLHGQMWIRAKDAVLLKTEASLAQPVEVAWIFATLSQLDFHYELHEGKDGIGPCHVETQVKVDAPFVTVRQLVQVDMAAFEPRQAVQAPAPAIAPPTSPH